MGRPKKLTEAQEKEFKRREAKRLAKENPVAGVEITKAGIEQAIVLYNKGVPPESIEAKTGVTEDELLKLDTIGRQIAPLSDKIKEILANQWYALAEKILQIVDQKDLKTVPSKELVCMAGIAQDKAREMENKPTQIIAQYIQVMEKIVISEEGYQKKYAGAV